MSRFSGDRNHAAYRSFVGTNDAELLAIDRLLEHPPTIAGETAIDRSLLIRHRAKRYERLYRPIVRWGTRSR